MIRLNRVLIFIFNILYILDIVHGQISGTSPIKIDVSYISGSTLNTLSVTNDGNFGRCLEYYIQNAKSAKIINLTSFKSASCNLYSGSKCTGSSVKTSSSNSGLDTCGGQSNGFKSIYCTAVSY